MNNSIGNIFFEKKFVFFLGYILLTIVVILNIFYLFLAPPLGDEGFYINEIQKVKQLGLYQAMTEGFSYLFVLISIALNLIVDNEYISMRLIGLASSIGILFTCVSLFKLLKIYVRFRLVYLFTVAYILTRDIEFVQGIPDRLMVLFILLGFKYFFNFYYNKKSSGYLWISGLFLGLSLWVRLNSLIFLLAFSVLFITLLFSQRKGEILSFFKMGIVWGGIIILIAALPQIPSLIENRNVAFENKNTSEYNWSVKNWFTHIERINNGSVFAYERVSWEKLDTLVKEYGGYEKIPRTVTDRFKADPKFFVDNILSNFFRILFFIISGLGFIGILSLDYFRRPEQIFKPEIKPLGELLFGLLVMISVIGLVYSIIIIGYIEWRWFTLPLIFCCLIGIHKLTLLKKEKLKNWFLLGQYIFLFLMFVNNIRVLSIKVLDLL